MAGEVKSVKDLEVFKKAHELALDIYKITSNFPREETYGLVSQMRRAAVSINSNLAEGGARPSKGEFRQFVGVARGSVAELEYQIKLSKDLGMIKVEDIKKVESEAEEISRMLTGLMSKISKN